MIRQGVCEALYALPNGVVQPRRRSVMMPIIIALVGVVLLVVNFLVLSSNDGALGMTLIVVGGALLLYGSVVTVMRIASSETVPYHPTTKSYMSYCERFYTHENAAELKAALAANDLKRIEKITTSNVSALTLAECRTKDGAIVALALYEYACYEDRLSGEVTIIQR